MDKIGCYSASRVLRVAASVTACEAVRDIHIVVLGPHLIDIGAPVQQFLIDTTGANTA